MSYSTTIDWKGQVLVVSKHSGTGKVDIWQIHEPTQFTIGNIESLRLIFNGNSVSSEDAVKILELVFQGHETTTFTFARD